MPPLAPSPVSPHLPPPTGVTPCAPEPCAPGPTDPAPCAPAPSVAVRVRQASRVLRLEIAERVRRSGFNDITVAQLVVFRQQPPDGRQPTEIAVSAQLSKQAANDVLGQLERSGYLRREAHPSDRRARIVRLTERGWALDAMVRETSREVERSWRARIGDEAWDGFRAVLDRIAAAGCEPPGAAGGR